MPKSPHFIRIKAQVLAVTQAVPRGKVTTFRSIGTHLAVMPRHVAYILARLAPDEQDETPWHRVVADDGTLGKTKTDARGRSQRDLLAADGVAVDEAGRVAGFTWRCVAAAALPHGLPQQRRPAGV